MKHKLKTDPSVFAAVLSGAKTHEIRFNDRNFQTGDELLLQETTVAGEMIKRGYPLDYTGREITTTVTHVLEGYGLMPGWVILSIAAPAEAERRLIWAAAGGKADDTPTQGQVVAAVRSLRAVADKFAELMVKDMSQSELQAIVAQAEANA